MELQYFYFLQPLIKSRFFKQQKKSTQASATIYRIIETAKANHLNTFKYLI